MYKLNKEKNTSFLPEKKAKKRIGGLSERLIGIVGSVSEELPGDFSRATAWITCRDRTESDPF